MFIIDLAYNVGLDEIDKNMKAHMKYLNEHYDAGTFIASGRKVPRTGGIILSLAKDKKEVEDLVKKDPFVKLKLASFTITEFNTSQHHPGLKDILGK